MTDLYRIKELEWDREGRGDCIAQSPLGEIRLHQYFDIYGCIAWEYQGNRNLTLREAKAAANDHHRKEVEKMLEPSPDRQLTTKEALANVDMEKVGLEASIEQLNVILEAKDMLLAEAANGLRDALGAFQNNNAIDWDELEQTLDEIKQELGEKDE